MTRTDIINALASRDIKAEKITNVKNGVKCEGIVLYGYGNMAPIIYTERLIEKAQEEGLSVFDVVDEIICMLPEKQKIQIDIRSLLDRDFVKEHLRIGVQKSSDQMLVKRPTGLEGIEAYLYLMFDDNKDDECFSINRISEILKNANISEAEAWQVAEKNNHRQTVIVSMNAIFGVSIGPDMYVITNKSGIRGAGAIEDKKTVKAFMEEKKTECLVVIPSSIHEMILIPDGQEYDKNFLDNMVKEVNSTQVLPEERLTDRAYLIHR